MSLSRRTIRASGVASQGAGSVPGVNSTLAHAIAAHELARAPYNQAAQINDFSKERETEALFNAAADALDAVVAQPCQDDAEFVEKLVYLWQYESPMWGGGTFPCIEGGRLIDAIAQHIETRRRAITALFDERS